MSTLITAVKNCEVIERSYIQYGTSSNQQKLLKYLLLEALQSAQIAFPGYYIFLDFTPF
jgi:hypothetical protein